MNVLPQYRTFWPRFWAGWIDGLVIGLPADLVDWGTKTATNDPYLLTFWFVVYSLAFYAYSVAMHAGYGQTLGKMVTGVKVLDLSGGKLSLGQAFLRDSVPILLEILAIVVAVPRTLAGLDPYARGQFTWFLQLQIYSSLVWFAAELLTMLLNSKRRAIHDFIAHSVVVRLSASHGVVDGGVAANAKWAPKP